MGYSPPGSKKTPGPVIKINLFTAWEDAIWPPCMTLHIYGVQRVKRWGLRESWWYLLINHIPTAFPVDTCENP